jgi:hypothetical protein
MGWSDHVPRPNQLGSGTQVRPRTGRSPTEGRYRWARAYRDGQLVCGRVELTVRADLRLGLAPWERRFLTARFMDRLDPTLRVELGELVRRHGAAAGRAAERMQPVEVVFDDVRAGRQRLVAEIQPPQMRRSELQEIEFGLREPAP